MDTNTLHAFLAVADTGSFSLASEQLFLTQPAISKRIAALEDELGTKVFERLARQVLLTEAGRVLLPKARHIVQEMADSRRLIADLSTSVGGTLQLATSHHIGLHRLPSVLRTYSLNYPAVAFDLHFMDSEQGCEAVAAGDVEMAVVTLPQVPAARLALRKVWDDPLAVMVRREHPLADGGKEMADLVGYPAIVPEKGTETRRLIEKPFEAAGLRLRAGMTTNYLETIRMLVSAGLGWSVLPLSMLHAEMVCVDVPGIRFHRELGIVTRQTGSLSRAAQAFCGMLTDDW